MRLIKKNLAALLCIVAVAMPGYAARAQAVDIARHDQAVLDMAQAFKLGERKQLTQLLPQAKGSLLEPWAAYWELSIRLDQADKAEIESFLARYAGTYQEDRLRAEWLVQLGRNREWATFRAQLPLYRMADERSIQCYALWSDYLASDADVAKQLQETWLPQREPDEACADAAQELIKARKMPAQAAWVRARLGMENDRLKVTTQAIATLDTKWVATVAAIYQSPSRYLNDKLTALRPQTREFVSLALIRLAYLDPHDAALEVEKLRWRAQLTGEERSWIWGVIGKRAAQKGQDNAWSYYQQGHLDQMHEDHVLWAVRAALRQGKWPQVEAAIAALPSALRSEPTWTYWHARAILAQKPTEAARAQAMASLQSIAGIRGFYEQLALEELGQRSTLPPKPLGPTPEERDIARRNAGLQRALHAIALGLRSDGVREWNYSISLHD